MKKLKELIKVEYLPIYEFLNKYFNQDKDRWDSDVDLTEHKHLVSCYENFSIARIEWDGDRDSDCYLYGQWSNGTNDCFAISWTGEITVISNYPDNIEIREEG